MIAEGMVNAMMDDMSRSTFIREIAGIPLADWQAALLDDPRWPRRLVSQILPNDQRTGAERPTT